MYHRPYRNRQGSVRRWTVAICLALAALFLLCFIILQAGTKYFLKRWLQNNGADQVTIETFWLNPFSGVATLEGVKIATAENTVYSGDLFTINLGVSELPARQILLEEAILRDMTIEVRSTPQGKLQVGSYILSPEGDSREPGGPFFSSWNIRVEEALLENIEINYNGTIGATLAIKQARGENLDSTGMGETGSFSFSGKLNQAPLAFELTRFHVADTLSAAGNISLSKLDLAGLQGLLPKESNLEGTASLDGTITLEKRSEGTLTQLFEGSIDLNRLSAGNHAWAAGGSLGWQGKIALGPTAGVRLDGSLTADLPSFEHESTATAVKLETVTAEGKATIAAAGTSRFTGDLALHGPEYSAGNSQGQAESANWQGTIEHEAAAGTAPARFTAEGQADSAGLVLDFAEDTGWQQSSINLDGTLELVYGAAAGEAAETVYTGNASLSGGALTIDRQTYNAAKLHHEGRLAYRPGNDGKQVVFDSTLSGEVVEGELGEKQLSWRIGESTIQGAGTVFIGGEHLFSGTGSIEFAEAEIFENGTAAVTLASLLIDGVQAEENDTLSVAEAAIDDLRFSSSSFLSTELTARSLLFSGVSSENFSSLTIDEAEAGSLALPSLNGTDYTIMADSLLARNITRSAPALYTFDRLSLHEATLAEKEERNPLGSTGEITIAGLEAGAGTLTAESITVDSARYRDPHVQTAEGLEVALASLQSSRVAWTPDSVIRIAKITGSGLNAAYTVPERPEDGDEGQQEAGEGTVGGDSQDFPLVIEHAVLEGKNQILYKDPTLPETFQTAIDIVSVDITDIALNEPNKRFSFEAEARVDKHSPLTLKGTGALLASPRIWEQTLQLDGYPLANLTPFLLNPLGKRMTGGKLELFSEMNLHGEQIEMENTLELKEIEMKTASKKRLKEFNSRLPIPLETALSFLRDGEGTIQLHIPIRGTLSSLDTSYTDIIVTALSNGISSAVKPMLAYTVLGPGGVLAYLGMKIGKDIISSNLPELAFEAGNTELTPGHTRQLDTIGPQIEQTLRNSQIPRYYVYPKVKPGELSGDVEDAALLSRNQRQKLYRLGERRAANVREYLLDNFNIEAEQLQIFQPGLLYEQDSVPSVTFMK